MLRLRETKVGFSVAKGKKTSTEGGFPCSHRGRPLNLTTSVLSPLTIGNDPAITGGNNSHDAYGKFSDPIIP